MAVGANDQYVRIYDRRMLGPGVVQPWQPVSWLVSLCSLHLTAARPPADGDRFSPRMQGGPGAPPCMPSRC